MRKVIIAAVVAAVLFSVGAFAAQLTINTEDVASGANDVVRCADVVDVDFVTTYVVASNDWEVTGAKLTFYDNTPGPIATTTACAGYGASLAVRNTSNALVCSGEATVAAATNNVTVNCTQAVKPLASAVGSAAVLVDGEDLQVGTPGGGF